MYQVHQIHNPNPQPAQPEAALVSAVLAPPLICSARGEVQRRASTDIPKCPTSTARGCLMDLHPGKPTAKHKMGGVDNDGKPS